MVIRSFPKRERNLDLGEPYKTKAAADNRLRQVEFFKRRKG